MSAVTYTLTVPFLGLFFVSMPTVFLQSADIQARRVCARVRQHVSQSSDIVQTSGEFSGTAPDGVNFAATDDDNHAYSNKNVVLANAELRIKRRCTVTKPLVGREYR